MILGAFHQAYKNKKATENVIKNFRIYYPNNPYFLFSDNGLDFSDLAKKYNCFYEFCDYNIGYDKYTGFGKQGSLEWLKRFNKTCLQLNTEYVIMLEDDVLIQNTIYIPEETEFYGLDVPGNKIPENFINHFISKYSAKFYNNWYGSGGGSIFRTKTFIENYEKLIKIFEEEYDYVKNEFNIDFGWVDLFMTTFYYVCGKKYTVNPFLTEVIKNPNWNNSYFSIVHHYKQFYET